MESFASLQTPNFGQYYAYSKNITSKLFRMSSYALTKTIFVLKSHQQKKKQ